MKKPPFCFWRCVGFALALCGGALAKGTATHTPLAADAAFHAHPATVAAAPRENAPSADARFAVAVSPTWAHAWSVEIGQKDGAYFVRLRSRGAHARLRANDAYADISLTKPLPADVALEIMNIANNAFARDWEKAPPYLDGTTWRLFRPAPDGWQVKSFADGEVENVPFLRALATLADTLRRYALSPAPPDNRRYVNKRDDGKPLSESVALALLRASINELKAPTPHAPQ